MNPITDSIVIDHMVLSIVRATATRLAGTYGFNRSDRDDIRQELLLDCFVRLRNFDPAKSSRRTFLRRVVRHRVATLLDAQRAACRDYRLCRDSIDDPVQFAGGDSIPFGETLSADDNAAQLGRNALRLGERVELRIDVAAVIATLPAELAAVAVALKSEAVIEVGRQMGLSRSTLHRRLVRIREVFMAAGLDRYLGQSKADGMVPPRGRGPSPSRGRSRGSIARKSKDQSDDKVGTS